MKRLIIIFIITSIATGIGLYLRPSYFMVGQLDWLKVLTKGYFVGSFSRFFTQGYIDESFYFVMRFTAGGLVGGFFLSMFFGSGKNSSSAKKKK